MAKRKYEFKPDPDGSGILNKLYMTRSQRLAVWKWTLFGALFILCLVVQDAMLARYTILGGSIDLAVSVIMLVCVSQGLDNGCVFAFAASAVYAFSGSAPGNYAIVLITFIASAMAVFREGFLSRGFLTDWLCAGVGAALYEMVLYAIGLMMNYTHTGRLSWFVMTAVLSVAVMPVLYPLVERTGKIGGDAWKE